MKLLLLTPLAVLLVACEAKVNTTDSGTPTKVIEKTTVVPGPSEKKVEHNTTIVNPSTPSTEKKTEKETSTTIDGAGTTTQKTETESTTKQ